MNQQERFEAFYADQHGVEIATMTQYRMGDTYRLPGIAAHYRTFKAAEDGMAALKHGEPVAWFTEDHLTDKSATTWDSSVAELWRAKGWPIGELFGRAALEVKP